MMQKAQQSGYTVRDERIRPQGQSVWSGPHIHLEIPRNLTGRAMPMARPQSVAVQPQSTQAASPTIDDILSGGANNAADSSNSGNSSTVDSGNTFKLPPQLNPGANEVSAGTPAPTTSAVGFAGDAPNTQPTIDGFNTTRPRTVTPPFNERDFRKYLVDNQIPRTQSNLAKLRPAYQAMIGGDPDAADKFNTTPQTSPVGERIINKTGTSQPFQGPSVNPYDAAWHMGITPDEFRNLTPRAARVISRAVQEDNRKRAAGGTIAPPDLDYQNQMRAKAGLRPLKYNMPVNAPQSDTAPYYTPDQTGVSALFKDRNVSPYALRNVNAQTQAFTPNVPLPPSDQSVRGQLRQQILNEQAQGVDNLAGNAFSEGPQGGRRQSAGTMSEADINKEIDSRIAQMPTDAERARAQSKIDELSNQGYFSRLSNLPIPAQPFHAIESTVLRGLAAVTPNPLKADSLTRTADWARNQSKVDALVNNADYAGDNTVMRGIGKEVVKQVYGLAPLMLTAGTTGISFPYLMAGQSFLESDGKPLRDRLTDAGVSYLLGKAYEVVPAKSVEGLQNVGGKIGQLATKYPGIASRVVGASEFGGAGAAQTLAAGGSAKQALISGLSHAIPGGLLAGSPEQRDANDRAIQARTDAIAGGLNNEGQPIRVVKGSEGQIEQIRQAERERRANELQGNVGQQVINPSQPTGQPNLTSSGAGVEQTRPVTGSPQGVGSEGLVGSERNIQPQAGTENNRTDESGVAATVVPVTSDREGQGAFTNKDISGWQAGKENEHGLTIFTSPDGQSVWVKTADMQPEQKLALGIDVHAANFRERNDDGTFKEGAAVVPQPAEAGQGAAVPISSSTNAPVSPKESGVKTNENMNLESAKAPLVQTPNSPGGGVAREVAPSSPTIDDVLSGRAGTAKGDRNAINAGENKGSVAKELPGIRNGQDISAHPEQVRESASGQAEGGSGSARGSEVKEPTGKLSKEEVGKTDANNIRNNEEASTARTTAKEAADENAATDAKPDAKSGPDANAKRTAGESNGELPAKEKPLRIARGTRVSYDNPNSPLHGENGVVTNSKMGYANVKFDNGTVKNGVDIEQLQMGGEQPTDAELVSKALGSDIAAKLDKLRQSDDPAVQKRANAIFDSVKEGAFDKSLASNRIDKLEKLPQVREKPIEQSNTLGAGLAGFAPGVKEFVSDDISPRGKQAVNFAKATFGVFRTISSALKLNTAEPVIKGDTMGEDAYAGVMRAIHTGDRAVEEFGNQRSNTFDANMNQLKRQFNRLPGREMEDFNLSRGTPESIEGQQLQNEAIARLKKSPNFPQFEKLHAAVKDASDSIWKYATDNGLDMDYFKDYFYGNYKDSKKVERFLDYWQTTDKYLKDKAIPTIADASAFGLELKDANPISNLESEVQAVGRRVGLVKLRDRIIAERAPYAMQTDGLSDVQQKTLASSGWKGIEDPVFKGMKFDPAFANLVNTSLETSNVGRNPFLKVLQQTNRTLRQIKFAGSVFHMVNMLKGSVADEAMGPADPRGYLKFGKSLSAVDRTDPKYLDYVNLGGGAGYSAEMDAAGQLQRGLERIGRGNILGGVPRALAGIAKSPFIPGGPGFSNWMFHDFIPTLKFAKYDADVSNSEARLGRPLSDAEKIRIIKRNQNFYGEMNERLFGRSSTATQALRIPFTAPGYGEGNFRTVGRALSGDPKAARFIASTLVTTALASTVATRILTGHWPPVPQSRKELRDVFKIQTGMKDQASRPLNVDAMTYDKDFWLAAGLLSGGYATDVNPGEEARRRVSGGESPAMQLVSDLAQWVHTGKVSNYKGQDIIKPGQTWGQKGKALLGEATDIVQPIPVSTYREAREKGFSVPAAIASGVTGIRATSKYDPEAKGLLYQGLKEGGAKKAVTEMQRLGIQSLDTTRHAKIFEGDKSQTKLTDDQQRVLAESTVKTLQPALEKLINSDTYQKMSDDAKKEAIKSIIKDNRSNALDNFKGQQYKQRQALMPTANQ